MMNQEATFTIIASWRDGFWVDQKRLTVCGYRAEAWSDGHWVVESDTVRVAGQAGSLMAAMVAVEHAIDRALNTDRTEAA